MQKRAILIGMSDYISNGKINAPKLPCTQHDIQILSKRLKQIDFTTEQYANLSRDDMLEKLKEFAKHAPCDSINIIYFSGHGGQSAGKNYMYPVDFSELMVKRKNIENSAIDIDGIRPFFEKNVKLIIIVDACRREWPSYGKNYSEMVAPKDTYIAYATQFGEVSFATREVSYFTDALCKNILEPNITVDELFTRVRMSLYLQIESQIANSVTGLTEPVSLNIQQNDNDDIGIKVVEFIDKYGDMYTDRFGYFAGDDLLFIDAAQYLGISVLDAMYKYQVLDAERCHIQDDLTEDEHKTILFWSLLDTGLKQDEYYMWKYRERPIRLGEIPPLPMSMQKPMPDSKHKIEVSFSIDITSENIEIRTNLPDNFTLYGTINHELNFSSAIVQKGLVTIPFKNADVEFSTIEIHSVQPQITKVDMSIIGDRGRNLTGSYVRFHPIRGNEIVFSYTR